MSRCVLSVLLSWVLVLVISTGTKVYAQTSAEETPLTAKDITEFYNTVNENVHQFNHLNDSLFIQQEQEEWVSGFLRRARLVNDLSQRNQQTINTFMNRLRNATTDDDLLRAFLDPDYNVLPQIDDDFLEEEVCRLFIERTNRIKDIKRLAPSAYIWLRVQLATNFNLTYVSGDSTDLYRAIDIYREIMDHLVPGRDLELNSSTAKAYIRACMNLVNQTTLVYRGLLTPKEMEYYRQLLEQTLLNQNFCEGVDDMTIKSAQNVLKGHTLSMLRNVYVADSTHRFDRVRDSLILSYVSFFDKYPDQELRLAPNNRRRVVLMRQQLGQISAVQALQICDSILRQTSPEILTEENLPTKFSNILECAYYVDVSDMTALEKHELIKDYCDEILYDLAHLSFTNTMPSLVRSLANVAIYPRIHNHLYPDERKLFLSQVLFFSQPFTRAHSETVTQLALTILNAVIDARPELLVGMLGYTSPDEVQKNPRRLISFFSDGARFHDLGKTRMPDIIRNEYRKLTDHEYSIIKRHPELGLEYLQVDSSLMQIHDIVLGHHKWYNGKGGYPASFDNTKSPYRVLIDILTLADCLEAATSRLGRNYRKNKHFDDLAKEFHQEAGTRYNPELVSLLETHPILASQLNELCEKGWEYIYYSIFNK